MPETGARRGAGNKLSRENFKTGRAGLRPRVSAAVLAALLLALTQHGGYGCIARAAAATSTAESVQAYALSLVNRDRDERGLAPMRETEPLARAAQHHAEEMASGHYLAHVSPEGQTAFDRYVAAGGNRWQAVAENIGLCSDCGPAIDHGDIAKLQSGWMQSASHRDHILAPDLDQFGFGIASDDTGALYAVQIFAGPGRPDQEEDAAPPGEQVERFFKLLNRDRAQLGIGTLRPKASLIAAAGEALARTEDPLHAADLLELIRQSLGTGWRALATVVGVCGGCGVQVTAADVEIFYARWMSNPDYRAKLMSPDFSVAGFAMRANGSGRKIALSLLGAAAR